MKRHRQKPNEEYNFWQPATDMMSGLVFVLVLIIALLGLYLLSDYTGYEEASSVSSEGPSSSGTGWNNKDPGGWYYDGGTGDGDGDGNGQFDQQIIQTGGGGGYGEDGIKTAVFVEVVDDETERRIPEAGVTFELYRTDTTHLQNGSLQTLNTYYPEKINYRDYETTEEGVFYLPEKIWQGSYYFHELTEPEGTVEGVKNYNIAVKKRGEDITFLRRIVRGPADDSYGIEVAKLAGLPGSVTRRAHEVLRALEATAPKNKVEQMDFDALQEYNSPAVPSEMMEKLEAVDVETLTPIEALNFLYELKKTLKGSLNG